MNDLLAPLSTHLGDQVKAVLAAAGYDMAVRHRKTAKLMRGGCFIRQPEADVVLVYHQAFPPSNNTKDRMTWVAKYADALPGHGFTFQTTFTPRGVPYIIVRRLV